MKEIWKSIPNYEWIYEINNYWFVKSLSYRNSHTLINREKILKHSINWPWYLCVWLSKDWIVKKYRVHRLVWLLFLDNPNRYLCINHIDGNKENNYYQNLEWCTSSQNNYHAYKTWLKVVTDKNVFKTNHPQTWKFWKDSPVSKTVNQYDSSGNFI